MHESMNVKFTANKFHRVLVPLLRKKFHAFCGTQKFITVLSRAHHFQPVLSQLNPFLALPIRFFVMHFNIIFQFGSRDSLYGIYGE
jgi:hypothetical protein